jgi:NADH-quinone oxidoreductase subunit F
VALRQPDVKSVTIFYRRTRNEMPAFAEEIEAALAEGIALETLVSPSKIHSENSRLTGVEFARNELGDLDASGRRRPVPISDSEFRAPLDTLIVAIGEKPDAVSDVVPGIDVTKWGTLSTDPRTLHTNRTGVFAGGDVVSGPNTVVDAIAAGKKAANVIDRFLRGESLSTPGKLQRPSFYIEPSATDTAEIDESRRAIPTMLSPESRSHTFEEVEKSLTVAAATRESSRCLRCDLDFTMPKEEGAEFSLTGAETN